MIKATSTLNSDEHEITPQELADWKARGILGEVVESDTHDKAGNELEPAKPAGKAEKIDVTEKKAS